MQLPFVMSQRPLKPLSSLSQLSDNTPGWVFECFILFLHLTSCPTYSALCWIALCSGIRHLAKLGAVRICCRGLRICDWVETQCSRSCWKHPQWLLSKCIDSAAIPERTSVWWGLGVMSDHATLFCPPLLLFYSLIYSFFKTNFLELCGKESLVEVFNQKKRSKKFREIYFMSKCVSIYSEFRRTWRTMANYYY